ncbi:MAG: cell division protein FtsQ/DivIB [Christensenellales bacterium]|jgi:cell division protein FtsQ
MSGGRKKGAGMILAVLTLMACLGFAGWELLKIKEIEVMGVEGDDADSVLSLAGIELDSNILLLDGALVKERVETNALLYVEKVDVQYPDKVVITAKKREEVCAVEYIGAYLIVDNMGYIMSVERQLLDMSYPLIVGMNTQNAVVGQPLQSSDQYQVKVMMDVMKAVETAGIKDIVEIMDISATGDIKLITRAGITIRLGQNEKLEKKMAWIIKVMPDMAGDVLDVSTGESANVYQSGKEQPNTPKDNDEDNDNNS